MSAHLGILIGNTGGHQMTVALRSSFSVRRGEFVRVQHKERSDQEVSWVLGRIVSLRREHVLFSPAMGEGLADTQMLTVKGEGELNAAIMEIIGLRDPETAEIRMPRRPLDPGAKIYGVDSVFLEQFYHFDPEGSVKLGHLLGYEKGPNVVPIYLDIDRIVTEHLAVLAMTGAGKSYTVGRIIERMLAQANASIIVFDPHGEYGNAFRGGKLNFGDVAKHSQEPDASELAQIRNRIEAMQEQGGGVTVYTPNDPQFSMKYQNRATPLALQLDQLEIDDIVEIFPDTSEAQQRVISVVLRYWMETCPAPRDVNELLGLLTSRMDEVRSWSSLSDQERKVLNDRSASIVALRLRRLLLESKSFYERGLRPFDIRELVGRRRSTGRDQVGRLAIIDMQGLSKSAMQVIVNLICTEVLKAASDKHDPIRPVFMVIEEGHTFAPAKEPSVAKPIIKRLAAEGRKFGVGIGIISQRPSKLDADVTSQCNTIVAMRMKNPDDQHFIRSTSDYFSEVDINELPVLSTGEALVSGRAILAPIIVRVGNKVLLHGGESPRVSRMWRGEDN